VARVLASLKPFVALLGQAQDSLALAEQLVALAQAQAPSSALIDAIADEVTDTTLIASTLEHAGVVNRQGQLSQLACQRLAQVQILLEAASDDGWDLVLTVPAFLRTAMDDLVAQHGPRLRPRETAATLAHVAAAARNRLIIAAPYLHTAFIMTLSPHLGRVLDNGGTSLVITRALSLRAPSRSSANVEAVAQLREIAEPAGRRFHVRSWEETGLGIHFKVIIADDQLAYLGSANLTPGAMHAHAEAGVLLHGSRVANLSRWIDAVADELARRRLPSG
jgi:phosphatidylserine/phosphatidylglycerophosphate/cardiolipin synthase-like enzyme